jgi:hypothetical protein
VRKDVFVSCIDQCASVDLAIDGYRETKESGSLGDQVESELSMASQAGLNLTG